MWQTVGVNEIDLFSMLVMCFQVLFSLVRSAEMPRNKPHCFSLKTTWSVHSLLPFICQLAIVHGRDLCGKTTMFPHPLLNSKKISLHRPSPTPSFPSPAPHFHHPSPHPPLTRIIISLTRPLPAKFPHAKSAHSE